MDKKNYNQKELREHCTDWRYIDSLRCELVDVICEKVKELCEERGVDKLDCRGLNDFNECKLFPTTWNDSSDFDIVSIDKDGNIVLDDISNVSYGYDESINDLNIVDLHYVWSVIEDYNNLYNEELAKERIEWMKKNM